MIRHKVLIVNKLGLHARAAAKLVSTASRFNSRILLGKDDREVDAKSILSVMMLAASKDTEIELILNGPDEEDAKAALVELIADYFGEGE